jgi:hypothetical protein
MNLVRHVLPAAICLVGIAAIAYDPERIEAGMLIISAGLSVWLLNWLFRLGVAGDDERDAEDRARDEYERTGRWPDE